VAYIGCDYNECRWNVDVEQLPLASCSCRKATRVGATRVGATRVGATRVGAAGKVDTSGYRCLGLEAK